MHSRLNLDQQQHLQHHLQHLNSPNNFNRNIFEKCCCNIHSISAHQSQHQFTYQHHQTLAPHHYHHHHHHHHHYQHHHQNRSELSQHTRSQHQQQQKLQYSPILTVLSSSYHQQHQQHQVSKLQLQNNQNSIAHNLYHRHQTLVATVSSSSSDVTSASISTPTTLTSTSTSPFLKFGPQAASVSVNNRVTKLSSSTLLSPLSQTLSATATSTATASTMYRRHNNLSYCGVSNQDAGQNYQVQYVDTELYHSNSSQSQMGYAFCPIGDYQPNGQSYYSTTSTANYSSALPLNSTNHTANTLPYIVPVEESLLLNTSSQSHSRDSSHSLTEVAFIQEAQGTSQTPTSTTANSVNITGGGSAGVIDASSENDQSNLGNTNKIASAT
ncbi:hypothetical protein DOY81_003289, partial [Sarcophaga bullata]